ncbi:putative zonadhesin [Apostichopus japonicus]|uniref:Putative zonadhesin n=1 Tax=Stichopus japonicus TaxID=307972 RepID=A0A2G8L8Q3_STIJA|nr:putative zonadhesin [Apostichopus japonicus]
MCLGNMTFTAPGFPTIQVLTGGILLLNNVQVFMPVQFPGILITGVYDNIIIRFDFGLNIVWKEGYAFIYLNPEYASKTCGLCGNFDGIVGNDNTHRTTGAPTSVNLFGDSYETGFCNLPAAVTSGQDLCFGKLY